MLLAENILVTSGTNLPILVK